MGHCLISEAYTRQFNEAIKDIPCKFKYVDNTLLYAASIEEALWPAYNFLRTCSHTGITLKPEKFTFCKGEIDLVGFHLDWDSYKPAEEHLSAIMSPARASSASRRPYTFTSRSSICLASQTQRQMHFLAFQASERGSTRKMVSRKRSCRWLCVLPRSLL